MSHSKDYMQSNAAMSRERVKLRLREIQYKLSVEEKVLAGTERMFNVITAGMQNKKRFKEVQDKLVECTAKVRYASSSLFIIQRVLRESEGLYRDALVVIDADSNIDSNGDTTSMPIDTAMTISVASLPEDTKKSIPFSGKFTLKLTSLIMPAASSSTLLSSTTSPQKQEHYIILKIDSVQKQKSKLFKKPHETLTVTLDKARECEILVYTAQGSLVGFLFFRVMDLMDSLAARKSNSTSDLLTRDSTHATNTSFTEEDTNRDTVKSRSSLFRTSVFGEEGVEYTLSLEPHGTIRCKFSLTPEKDPKKVFFIKLIIMKNRNILLHVERWLKRHFLAKDINSSRCNSTLR